MRRWRRWTIPRAVQDGTARARTVSLDFCRRIFGPVSVKRSGLRGWSPSRRFTTPAVLASTAPKETIPKRDGTDPQQWMRKSGMWQRAFPNGGTTPRRWNCMAYLREHGGNSHDCGDLGRTAVPQRPACSTYPASLLSHTAPMFPPRR